MAQNTELGAENWTKLNSFTRRCRIWPYFRFLNFGVFWGVGVGIFVQNGPMVCTELLPDFFQFVLLFFHFFHLFFLLLSICSMNFSQIHLRSTGEKKTEKKKKIGTRLDVSSRPVCQASQAWWIYQALRYDRRFANQVFVGPLSLEV